MVDRRPRPVALGQVAPRRSAAQHPEHPVERRTRRDPLPSRRSSSRHQRLDQLPLFIRDFVASHPFDPPCLAVRDEVAASCGMRPFSDRA